MANIGIPILDPGKGRHGGGWLELWDKASSRKRLDAFHEYLRCMQSIGTQTITPWMVNLPL